jgi:hypothetical protein
VGSWGCGRNKYGSSMLSNVLKLSCIQCSTNGFFTPVSVSFVSTDGTTPVGRTTYSALISLRAGPPPSRWGFFGLYSPRPSSLDRWYPIRFIRWSSYDMITRILIGALCRGHWYRGVCELKHEIEFIEFGVREDVHVLERVWHLAMRLLCR